MHQKQKTNLYVISCSLTKNCYIHQGSLIIHITHGKVFYRLCEWIFPLRNFIYDSMKDDDIRIPPVFRNKYLKTKKKLLMTQIITNKSGSLVQGDTNSFKTS